MKTWRQGVVGRVLIPGRPAGILRCLTYPLAQVFGRFDPQNGGLGEPQGLVRVRLDDFGPIERIGDIKLTAAEKRIRAPEAPWSAWTQGPG